MHVLNEWFKSVYVINLKARTDRMQAWEAMARREGLRYERAEAICPDDLPRLGLKPFKGKPNEGWMCASLSHRVLHERGPWPMLIFEDDAHLPANSDRQLRQISQPPMWDCIMLNPCMAEQCMDVGDRWWLMRRFYYLQAYGVTRRGSEVFKQCISLWNSFTVDTMLSNAGFGFLCNVYGLKGFMSQGNIGHSDTERPGRLWLREACLERPR